MNAELVMIGTELVLGQIVDTNAAYMAQQLNAMGVDVLYKTTVGDDPIRMKAVLTQALARVDVVITSGGLGPTEDDLTREAAAEATGRPLVLHEGLLRQIEQIFLSRNLDFKPNNKRQAYIPDGALPIENPQGTAPGFVIEAETGALISIPGVPREMKYLLHHSVLPYLRKKIGRARVLRQRLLKICGMGESNVDAAVGDLMRTSVNPEIGLLAHAGQTDIRLAAKADTAEEAEQLLGACEQRIRERLPSQIFGVDTETQEGVIVRLLHKHHLRLALAETNTGGRIAQHLIRVPEAAEVFAGGVVISNTAALENLLELSPALLAEHPLINPEIAQQIAEAVKLRCNADLGLGVCGHLRSANELTTDATVPAYIALCQQDHICSIHEYKTAGSADMIQSRVMNMALELLRRTLLGLDPTK